MINMFWVHLKTNPKNTKFFTTRKVNNDENHNLFNNYYTRIRRLTGKSKSRDALWHPKTMKYPSTNCKPSQERLLMTLLLFLNPKKDKKNTKIGYSIRRTMIR